MKFFLKKKINCLRLEGGERVNRMNAQQQADWLRQVDNNKGGRGLARRAEKTAGTLGL